MIVSPSFLTADFNNLEAEIRSIQFAKWLHFDVMDGRFVPKITYNQEVVKKMRPSSSQFFDVHLMIEEPEKEIAGYIAAGADSITFHVEAAKDPSSLIRLVKSFNKQVGMSVNPATPAEALDPYLPYLDIVLVMSVEPGKGGQMFMGCALDKIRHYEAIRKNRGWTYKIEVDGGINAETAKKVQEAGADVVVAGSYVFGRTDRKKAIRELENA